MIIFMLPLPILSGSQNFLLADNVAQSLAGRVAIFKLLPLSHLELRGHTLNYQSLVALA